MKTNLKKSPVFSFPMAKVSPSLSQVIPVQTLRENNLKEKKRI